MRICGDFVDALICVTLVGAFIVAMEFSSVFVSPRNRLIKANNGRRLFVVHSSQQMHMAISILTPAMVAFASAHRPIVRLGPTKVGTRPPSTWRIVQSEIAAKDLLLLVVGAALRRRRFHECDRRWRQRAF